jgi:hypothetical protein
MALNPNGDELAIGGGLRERREWGGLICGAEDDAVGLDHG